MQHNKKIIIIKKEDTEGLCDYAYSCVLRNLSGAIIGRKYEERCIAVVSTSEHTEELRS